MHNLLNRLHREERGAIVLLLLAAFLIVFMTALVLYDTGRSARDKMDVQIAADTAAYSQAAVKARSMNMIAYANVAKRTFHAFDTMYTSAYLGMITAQAGYSAACAAGWVIGNLPACKKAVEGLLYIAGETIELLATNLVTMGAWVGGGPYAAQEVRNLNAYQTYLKDVGPWWGWSENLTRGMRNGATMTSAWPPPPGNLADINSAWVSVSTFLDTYLNTDIYKFYPSLGKKDKLPIKQHKDIWGHVTFCASTATSLEYLWMWGEHYVRSSGFAKDVASVLAGVLATPLGCLASSMIYGDDVLPFELDPASSYASTGDTNTDPAWLQATSNITFSYKMDLKRLNSDRNNYNYVNKEYGTNIPLVKGGGGYFSVARSEISYDSGIVSDVIGSVVGSAGVSSAFGQLLGGARDVLDQPGMYAARWTARMRPMELNGEDSPHFAGMFKDVLPYMLLSSPIAFANSPASFSLDGAKAFGQAALLDLVFLEIASAGMDDGSGMHGFVQ